MNLKKSISLLLSALLLCALFSGCAAKSTSSAGSTADKAILVVSFGTSYNDSRNITIGAIESAIAEAYPGYLVRRAFTAQTIIDILEERDGIDIDNVTEALDKLVSEGIQTLVVQPTHLMDGYEYHDLIDLLGDYKDKFDSIVVGAPLLYTAEDRAKVIDVITAETAAYSNDDTAIIFMGHGTEADSNAVYATMQKEITAAGYDNYYIGTVEATPSLDDMIAAAKAGGYAKVVLEPLMVVAGDHANNDMAGDEEDSWKSVFEAEGFDVECLIRGLGQFWGIQSIYVQHVQDVIDGNGTVIK
jgi:sirohydrochlorin cobaltochelatase